MSEIILKGLFTGPLDSDAAGISDLDLRQVGGVWHLYVTTRAWAGITTFEVDATGELYFDGRMAVDTYAGFPPTDHTFIEANSTLYFQGLGHNATQFDSYTPTASGTIDAVSTLSFTGGPDTSALAITTATAGGQTFAITSQFASATLQVYRQDTSDSFALASLTNFDDAGITRLETTVIGGQTFVFATTAATVESFRLTQEGALTALPASASLEGLGLSNPSHFKAVTLSGVSYLLVAGQGSSSVSVLQVSETGALFAVDHVIDDLSTRFASISELATVETNNRVFVAVAGSDDGVTLLELLPDGRLLFRDTIADGVGSTLDNVSGLAMFATGETLHIYVSTAREAGVTQFEFEIGLEGSTITRIQTAEILTGTNGNDVLAGAAGDDVLQGGAGDDVLIDGAGADRLSGGAGKDVFVFRQDGDTDVITDFKAGADRIDLSTFAQLRSADQLLVTSTQTGAEISYAGETLVVQSMSGQSLSTADLGLEYLVSLTHGALPPRVDDEPAPPPEPLVTFSMPNVPLYNFGLFSGNGSGAHVAKQFNASRVDDSTETGTIGDDTLDGGLGQDTLNGRDGDDFLIGGAGADTFVFNAGRDEIADFVLGVDSIQLQAALFSSVFVSVHHIFQQFASVQGDATVLDFGAGNALIVSGITDLDALSDDVFL